MAVYTPVGDAALERFLSGYRLGALLRFEPIPEGIDNTNYLLEASSGRYVLTLFENRIDPADLPFFVDLMDYLAVRGVPCPAPVRRLDGTSLAPLAGRTALIVTFLEGRTRPRCVPGHRRSAWAASSGRRRVPFEPRQRLGPGRMAPPRRPDILPRRRGNPRPGPAHRRSVGGTCRSLAGGPAGRRHPRRPLSGQCSFP